MTYKLAGMVCAASTPNVSNNPPGLLTYKNDSYGVNIQYPVTGVRVLERGMIIVVIQGPT